ncbi:MAG: metallophosphoesterase family protein [Candidatus Marinimicrobia bacterium]|nr:metallophosphoesterase family protein [Candidatus Neomarinimicrobiota bacterium]
MKLNVQKFIACIVLVLLINLTTTIAADWTQAAQNPFPSKIPDHVILTWSNNPTTSQSVTWRTDTTVNESWAEIAESDDSPDFTSNAKRLNALTQSLSIDEYSANYHSVTFSDLKSKSLYVYRVGSENNWSEWFQFRTANDKPEPFTFTFLGDGQNALLSLWSRVIRAAYSRAPETRFIIHGGDLVAQADNYDQWNEWFLAAGWINGMIPIVPVPGNHGYYHGHGKDRYLNKFWFAQFTLPENGISSLPESNYYFDYQGARFIILNSNEKIEEQTNWLKSNLVNNPNRWTIIAFHHTIYSATNNRDHKEIRNRWKPIFDNNHADLILMGHDHTYARGHNIDPKNGIKDPETGPVYVVSVSGPKLYDINKDRWMDRAAENTQLYQIIHIDNDVLNYKSYTATGQLYDEFDIRKNESGLNIFIDKHNKNIPERTFKNTLNKP